MIVYDYNSSLSHASLSAYRDRSVVEPVIACARAMPPLIANTTTSLLALEQYTMKNFSMATGQNSTKDIEVPE
jgi:hypothetical protein